MAPSYRFGKGPIVVALEATLRNKVTFDKLYADLTKALGQITSAGDTNFTSDFKTQLAQEQRDHLDKDVFGEGQPDQIAAAEGRQRRVVYYEGLKRAMDLALNLGGSAGPVPVEIFWGCGQPRNEVWISWDNAGGPGVTLFVLSTDPASPGQDTNVVEATLNPPHPGAIASSGTAPEAKGLYVVRADEVDDGSTSAALGGTVVIKTYKADPNVIGV